MAEKLFSLGEGIRVRKGDVSDFTWSFDLRFPYKIASAGRFRTIGDLEESVGLEFFFSGGMTHQWFSETPDGHFLNSFTNATSETPLALYGAIGVSGDTEIDIKGEGDSYYFRLGVSDTELPSISDDRENKDKKFQVSVGTNLSSSHLSFMDLDVAHIKELYPNCLPTSISFRNKGVFTPGGLTEAGMIECSWLSAPDAGLLEGYLRTTPVGEQTLEDTNRTLALRSNTTDYDLTLMDQGNYGSVPHSIKSMGNTHHRTGDSLFGSSSLMVSGLEFYHSTDFDLVGRMFEFIFNTKIDKDKLGTWVTKLGSYAVVMEEIGENFFLNFKSQKNPADPLNLWMQSHASNKSQYLNVPYSTYFLNGNSQGSEVPYTLQFVAKTGTDSDQPIFRQKPLLGEDGDVHVVIDRVGGIKWKNGTTGAVDENVAGITLDPETFYHFAVVFDGTDTRVYVDGQLINVSSDHISIADLDAIEIGHAFMGVSNATEVFITTAQIAWLTLDKGIAKWIGSFNPPTSPSLETHTVLLLDINQPSGIIADTTPHAHPVELVNGGLDVRGEFIDIITGQIPSNMIGQWAEIRFRRNPGIGAGIYCNGKDITTAIQDPIVWENSSEALIFVPDTDQTMQMEDVSLVRDAHSSLKSIFSDSSKTSGRRNLCDRTGYNESTDISSNLAAMTLGASSEDATNVLSNVIDEDPGVYWTSEDLVDAVNVQSRKASISFDDADRIDINKIELQVSGTDANRHADYAMVWGRKDGKLTLFNESAALTWTDNKETLDLMPSVPSVNTGEMGLRVHPCVGRFRGDDGKEYLSVIAGTPANHFGRLNLDTNKWTVNSDNSHNRIGARGIYYTKASMQQVIGIWSGDTADNDYYEIDAATGAATLISTNGTPPAGKIHYCAGHYVNGSSENCMLIFGGFDGISYTSTVHELNLETMTWTLLTPSGSPPLVRAQATSAMYKNGSNEDCMIVFGGTNGTTWYNDVYELNLATTTWTQLTTSGTPPIARETAPSNLIYKNDSGHNILIVYGGISNGNEQSDYSELNIDTTSWDSDIPIVGNNPPGCRGSEGVLFKDKNQDLCMILVGGNNDSGMYNDRSGYCFYHPILNISQREWKTKTPIATDANCSTDIIPITFENVDYLVWMHKGRYLYGLQVSTGSIFEFNTDIHAQVWDSNYVDDFSFSKGDNKLGVYGGHVGGVISVPTRNFFEISLTDLRVTPISMSGDMHPETTGAIQRYFKGVDGNESSIVYGGKDDLGDDVIAFTNIDNAGACSTITLDPKGGDISDNLFYRGLMIDQSGTPQLFLYAQESSGLEYLMVNVLDETSSSGRIISDDGTMITKTDSGAIVNGGIFFYDSNALPKTFKYLDIAEGKLRTETAIADDLPVETYQVGSYEDSIHFISTVPTSDYYFQVKDGSIVTGMKQIVYDTVHDELWIELIYSDELVEVSEVKIFSENPIMPLLGVDPTSDTKQNVKDATGVVHSSLRSTSYSPNFNGIVDPDNTINNIGSAFILDQTEDGTIVIDNTGLPARRALVKVDVSSWGANSYELQDKDLNVIDYGFIQTDNTISSSISSEILLWIDLEGNAFNKLTVKSTVASSFLTTSEVYDVTTLDGAYDEWFNHHSTLSYLPVCSVMNGSVEDQIVIDDTLAIEANFATAIAPNFVVININTPKMGQIVVEAYNGSDWDVIGYVKKIDGTFLCGRVFCSATYQKFRIVVPAEFETEIISGFDFYSVENGALSDTNNYIKTVKRKMWNITASSGEEINEYDQNLPCIVTGSVTTNNSPSMHMMMPPLVGTLLYQSAVNTPSVYPYNAMITTGDKTRIDANVSAIKSVSVQASDDVRLAFSFDDRVTWVAWTGSWTVVNASTPAQLYGTGMTIVDVESIPSSAWDPELGSGKTIDVAVCMHVEAPTSQSIYDNVTFEVEGSTSNNQILTYGPNKNFSCQLDDANITFRNQAAITADDAYAEFGCGNLETGVNADNLVQWTPPADGFLTKVVGNSFDKNPGYIYLADGRPPVYPFLGQGWFNERQTIKQIDLTNGTLFTVKEDTFAGNSEGGISFSNGQTGYMFGIDERASSIGFLDKIDFATGTVTRNRDDLIPLYSRGACSDTVRTLVPPMEGEIYFRSVDFASDTKVVDTRVNGKSTGWEDQGSVSNSQNGYFFNFDTSMKVYRYEFATSTDEIVERQDVSDYTAVKGLCIPSLDQGVLLAASATPADRLRSLTLEFTNDTTLSEANSILPMTSPIYNGSVNDRDSSHSRVADNDRCLLYIYNNESKCLEMEFSVKLFTFSGRMDSEIASGKEGYKAAGMSGLGYII